MTFRVLALAFVALAALLGACGGGGDDDAGADRAERTPAATAGGDQTPAPATARDGDDDGAAPLDGIDACALVTRDEAAAALGVAVGEGQRDDFSPVYSCRYEGEIEAVNVSVLVYPDEKTAKEGHQMAVDINDYPEIEGIGEGAYFALGFGVTALQGKYEVSVDVIGPDDDQPLEEDLVRKALDRLP